MATTKTVADERFYRWLFVPKSWQDRFISFDVLSGDDWNRLSDHNPVVLRRFGKRRSKAN